jgi:hypothetical protein
MENKEKKHNQISFIRELCKDKSEEEIQAAEQNFLNFLDTIRLINARLERENTIPSKVDRNTFDNLPH